MHAVTRGPVHAYLHAFRAGAITRGFIRRGRPWDIARMDSNYSVGTVSRGNKATITIEYLSKKLIVSWETSSTSWVEMTSFVTLKSEA